MNLKEAIEAGFEPGPGRSETIVTPGYSWQLEDGRDYSEPVAIQVPIREIAVEDQGYDPAEVTGVNVEAVGPFAAGTLRVAYFLPGRVVLEYRPVPWNHVYAHGQFQRVVSSLGHPLYPEIDFAALGPDVEPPVEAEEVEAPAEDPVAGDEAPVEPETVPAAPGA